MKKALLTALLLLFLSNADSAFAQESKSKEGLGIRLGYVKTTSKLDGSFGSGLGITIHFIELLHRHLKLDFSLGSFYLGETSREDITRRTFLSTGYRTKMNVLFFSVAPLFKISLPRKSSLYVSGGFGLYSVQLLLDAGFFSSGDYQYHLGVNTNAGFNYALTSSLKLDLNFAVHRFWTSNDPDDWFYVYSEGDKNPYFYEGSVGIIYFIK